MSSSRAVSAATAPSGAANIFPTTSDVEQQVNMILNHGKSTNKDGINKSIRVVRSGEQQKAKQEQQEEEENKKPAAKKKQKVKGQRRCLRQVKSEGDRTARGERRQEDEEEEQVLDTCRS
jgi:hypothetical protein